MKSASERQRGECNRYINSNPPPAPGPELDCMHHLLRVADTFFQAQQQRHTADYDSSKTWTRTEVISLIDRVDTGFQSWRRIRDQAVAQAYLISLLGNPKAT